jgi:LysR family glycine cleavage system transcriptional activator
MARRTLPPLNGLRAFEAAARLGGFAAAADELGVTAGAVSQRVRDLEQRMGVALFERYPQSLGATRTGRELLPVLTQAFDAIDAAVRRARAPAAAALPLRVACPAGFAAGWLLPRLDRFHQRAPSVALTLTATERLIEPGDGDGAADVAIRFGRAGWSARLGCDFLFSDRRIPVCSPQYLVGHAIEAAGADPLAGHTLLEALPAADDWRDWLRWTSAPARDARRLSFGDERLTMDAAERGLGLALVDRALAVDALAAGRLVAPLEPAEMRRGTAWFLVYPAAAAPAAPALAAFRDWLLEETDRSLYARR